MATTATTANELIMAINEVIRTKVTPNSITPQTHSDLLDNIVMVLSADTYTNAAEYVPSASTINFTTTNSGVTYSVTGVTDTVLTGGTYNATGGTLTLTNSDASNVVVTGLTSGGGTFTGNTSGTCISDIYVSNLHSCSPLNLLDGDTPVANISSNGLILEDGIDLTLGTGSTINANEMVVNDLSLANITTGTSVATLSVDATGKVISGATASVPSNYVNLGNVAGSTTVDGSTGKFFYATMTGNTNFEFVNVDDGDEIVLMSAQGTAGNASNFLDADIRWSGGSVPLQFPTINTYTIFRFVKLGGLMSGTYDHNYTL